MKKKLIIGGVLTLALITTGGVMALQSDPKPEPIQQVAQEEKKVEAEAIPPEVPKEEEAPQAQTLARQSTTPAQPSQCQQDKADALAPLQTRMNDLRTKYLDNPERIKTIVLANHRSMPGDPNYDMYYQRVIKLFQDPYDQLKAEYDAKAAQFNC